MAGRRPKPSHLKVLEGTARADRMPTTEPVPPDGAIVRPDFLKYRSVELWEEYAPICIAMGTLTVADVPNFAMWCKLAAEFEENFATFNASMIAQTRMLAASFGMDASARAKLGTSSRKKDADPADEFFAAG